MRVVSKVCVISLLCPRYAVSVDDGEIISLNINVCMRYNTSKPHNQRVNNFTQAKNVNATIIYLSVSMS